MNRRAFKGTVFARWHWAESVVFAVAYLCFTLPVAGQENSDTLSQRCQTHQGAVRTAKLFPQLGDAYVSLVHQKVNEDAEQQLLHILERYIACATRVHNALRETIPDPEKKSDGFRQMEVHLRKSIRILSELAYRLPVDQRDPFMEGIQELQQIQSQLIQELFPTTAHY